MRYLKLGNFLSEVFETLFADKEKLDFLDNVPQFCRQCELLGICRDKDNHWKCHHGCMVISPERKNATENKAHSLNFSHPL